VQVYLYNAIVFTLIAYQVGNLHRKNRNSPKRASPEGPDMIQ
jgi:hypothetical protein